MCRRWPRSPDSGHSVALSVCRACMASYACPYVRPYAVRMSSRMCARIASRSVAVASRCPRCPASSLPRLRVSLCVRCCVHVLHVYVCVCARPWPMSCSACPYALQCVPCSACPWPMPYALCPAVWPVVRALVPCWMSCSAGPWSVLQCGLQCGLQCVPSPCSAGKKIGPASAVCAVGAGPMGRLIRRRESSARRRCCALCW